jgi:hypothetical protein
MAVRNPTTWTPPTGSGYVEEQGNLNIITNSGKYITTNSGNKLVTNTTYNIPKFATKYTITSKNPTTFIPSYVTDVSQYNIVDQLSNFIVDQLGNFIVSGLISVTPKNSTLWTPSGL